MRILRAAVAVAIGGPLLLVGGELRAADPPKFEFGKVEAVDQTVWKASAQGGLVLSGGNSSATAGAAGLTIARNAGRNKLAMDLSGAYARTEVDVSSDADADGFIGPGELTTERRTSSRLLSGRLRYDRFFTERSSAFAAALAASDRPSGKELTGGGQVGWSRLLYRSETSTLTAELGYDFSFEKYVDVSDVLAIHSARLFAGAETKLAEATAFAVGVEVLENLNPETTATGTVDPFGDLRINGKGSITTKVFSNISLRFGVTVRYDREPAPRPKLKLPFAMGFQPRADTTDVLSEATVVVTLF
jgi:hypothetical protein